jgi:OOP family OmpA-OmpF porin
MNYSTLKKTVVLSLLSLMVIGFASAQTTTTSMMVKSDSSTSKLFAGTKQYNTWSVGINAGVTTFGMLTGGNYKWYKNPVAFGFGASVSKQLSHFLTVDFEYQAGNVVGHNSPTINDPVHDFAGNLTKNLGPFSDGGLSSTTRFHSFSLGGAVNIGSVSFLKRKNNVNFYAKGGIGLIYYNPTTYFYNKNTAQFTYSYTYRNDWFHNVPPTHGAHLATDYNPYNVGDDLSLRQVEGYQMNVGVGVKFKITDAVALDLGYTENFLDGFNFTGVSTGYPSVKDKFSYGYGGIEYTFGPSSKQNLEWVNPIAVMYDELYDQSLRDEVEALKKRVTNVENAVNDLKKDSDGDGVSDQFDKCPNTPAGTVVDGAGCPIIFPKPIDTSDLMHKPHGPVCAPYSAIQFEFDSSVLKTASYCVLDATAADIKASGATVELDGYASSEGTASHNMRLSRDRANSVKTYLVNSGVEAKKLKVKGFGETHPIADNSTEEGRILNRRVEFMKK